MLVSFDKTNFPLLVMEGLGVEVHLLPITKWQFEQYVAQAGGGGRSLYKKMLALNPAVAPEAFTADNREQLFVTGVLPQEALAFARWLGEGYDLPTLQEWRDIYAALGKMLLPQYDLSAELLHGASGVILKRLARQLDPLVMLDLASMRDGVVEWVRDGRNWTGLGAPRPQFQPNLWNPLDHAVSPIQPDERLPYFGFRLLRRGEWYLADKDNVKFIY